MTITTANPKNVVSPPGVPITTPTNFGNLTPDWNNWFNAMWNRSGGFIGSIGFSAQVFSSASIAGGTSATLAPYLLVTVNDNNSFSGTTGAWVPGIKGRSIISANLNLTFSPITSTSFVVTVDIQKNFDFVSVFTMQATGYNSDVMNISFSQLLSHSAFDGFYLKITVTGTSSETLNILGTSYFWGMTQL